MRSKRLTYDDHDFIQYWVLVQILLVFALILVGGLTRLTGSGLSMVNWSLFMEVIPPLTDASWQQVFAEYKKYPEYVQINAGMSLENFKRIYYWEWGHRVLGRLLGVVFLVPFVVLLWRKSMGFTLAIRLVIAFGLGGLQAAMGWYMVKSGLVDRPSVSHLRLAAHLMLALLIGGWLLWIFWDLRRQAVKSPMPLTASIGRRSVVKLWPSYTMLFLLVLQIVYGAFTAGLKAGLVFNTFPTFGGEWWPQSMTYMEPLWQNLVFNQVAVQWMHRVLATVLLVGAFAYALYCLRQRGKHALLGIVFAILITCQYALGIATLLERVPLGLASSHQLLASVCLVSALACVYSSHLRSQKL